MIKNYDNILNILKNGSIQEIESLFLEKEECFYFDLKEIACDYSCRKNMEDNHVGSLSKNISGFGNSLGGVLIFGVGDKDKKIKPFKGYEVFRNLINNQISRSTNPQHESIETFSRSFDGGETGIVYLEIPQSSMRPLQTITNSEKYKYYYRSGESHSLMPHDVIVGMLGKNIIPELNLLIQKINDESFSFIIVNKSQNIIKNLWFNCFVDLPYTSINKNNLTNMCEGIMLPPNFSFILKQEYCLPPDSFFSFCDFMISKEKITFRNLQDKDYIIKIGYGCEGSKKYNIDIIFTRNELSESLDNHNLIELILEKIKAFSEQ